MALSTVTAANMLAQLRYRLREATANVWTDAELYTYLDIAQYEVAVKLDGISDIWYGDVLALTDPSTSEDGMATHDISGNSIMKVKSVHFQDTVAGTHYNIPIYPISELLARSQEAYRQSSYVCAIHGEKLYYLPAQSIGGDATIYVYYSRVPTAMAGVNALDVPAQYQDLVVMFAVGKAIEKLNQVGRKDQIEKQISEKLVEIKNSFMEEKSGNISPIKKSSPIPA